MQRCRGSGGGLRAVVVQLQVEVVIVIHVQVAAGHLRQSRGGWGEQQALSFTGTVPAQHLMMKEGRQTRSSLSKPVSKEERRRKETNLLIHRGIATHAAPVIAVRGGRGRRRRVHFPSEWGVPSPAAAAVMEGRRHGAFRAVRGGGGAV